MIDREYQMRKAGIVPGLIPAGSLPKTRLELRWERDDDGVTLYCRYELIIELFDLDIRGESDDGNGGVTRSRELRRSLGGTTTSGSTGVDDVEGTIRTPYRDHCHIRHDSRHTGIPAFVVADGLAMRILPANFDKP